MSAMIPFFSSCSDDDSVNEWDMSYVSLLPADYLRPTPSFTLKHVEEEGNGDDWVSIGQWDTKGRTQTITFDERVKTRYLKYQMITVPSRVDITRFYIYAW